jgi:hypothetical protein
LAVALDAEPRQARAPRLALAPLLAIGGLVAAVLLAFAGGYGPHRDELYFVAAGDHLAWGYPDQGPLTPLLARAMTSISESSLTLLRLPSALLTATTVVLTGAIARELGGGRRAQLVAAACAAVAADLLVTGHLLSTSTFDLTAWAAVTWLAARAIRTGAGWPWLAAGAAAGLGLLNKPLIAFLMVALLVGAVVAGPRRLLRSGWVWGGVAIALALWAPWLVWQADHGWPQLDVSSQIAGGGSASSESRWALLPFQLLLVSPVLAPVWIAGLVALARRPALRPFRLFAVAWLTLVVVFTVTGGKPYYLGGMFPVLLAAGGLEATAWLARGRQRVRRALLTAAIGLSAVVSATIALPVLPRENAEPVIAVNEDVGETIGWPELVDRVAAAARQAGGEPVVFTANYGEAGAVDRYGPALGLPPAASGHNGYAEWSRPPDGAAPVVLVGIGDAEAAAQFRGCRLVDRIDNAAGIENEEQGASIRVCDAPREPWSRSWDALERLG